MCKPAFFDAQKKLQEAAHAIEDVQAWLRDSSDVRWDKSVIALEMGGILKAKSKLGVFLNYLYQRRAELHRCRLQSSTDTSGL